LTKKRTEKPKREVSRHQLSQWQRQKRRQRLIAGIGIFIIAAVLGILGVGWYSGEYQPRQQVVIRVNDTEFKMDYYLKMLQYSSEGYPDSFISTIADQVVTGIQQNELIRQEAMKLGITVSDSEVDDELKERDPPLDKDFRDLVRTEMLLSRLRDGYFEQQVPLFAEQKHIMAMFLESMSQAAEVRARLENGEDFGELAAELSLDDFSRSESGDLGWYPEGILSGKIGTTLVEEYAFSAEAGVLGRPIYDEAKLKYLGYWLVKVLERETEEPEEVHLQVMLFGSEEAAQSARDRLEAGEDFAALAEEVSQHDYSKADGGDIGWVLADEVGPAVAEFVFDAETELEAVSEPIRDETAVTRGGYWLVQVVEEDDNRKISDEDRDLLINQALDEWLTALWDDPENEIESYLDGEQKAWAIEKVTGS